jgi:hypothetical protein
MTARCFSFSTRRSWAALTTGFVLVWAPGSFAQQPPQAPAEAAKAAETAAETAPQAAPNPHGLVQGAPPRDRSSPNPNVPPGQVHVAVVDAQGQPIKGAQVALTSHYQSIAEGNSEKQKIVVSGETGKVVFENLETAIRYSYSVSVKREGATYALPAFRLDKVGHEVLVHTYPVTSDPKKAFVGLQGFVTVRVKEDLLRIDTVYRVINMSRSTYVPAPIKIGLPENAQGLEAELSEGDSGFRQVEGGIELVGTFPPGQKDIPFAFHVENENEESQSFRMQVPPHVVDMNVLTEASPGMDLSVSPGFEPAIERTGRDDKKVLLTRRVLRPGDSQLESVEIELSGLPVVGPGRWWAVLAALGIVALGVVASFYRTDEETTDQDEERQRARGKLLDEMILLQRALDQGEIGPHTFEQTKREILNALARLEPATELRAAG